MFSVSHDTHISSPGSLSPKCEVLTTAPLHVNLYLIKIRFISYHKLNIKCCRLGYITRCDSAVSGRAESWKGIRTRWRELLTGTRSSTSGVPGLALAPERSDAVDAVGIFVTVMGHFCTFIDICRRKTTKDNDYKIIYKLSIHITNRITNENVSWYYYWCCHHLCHNFY